MISIEVYIAFFSYISVLNKNEKNYKKLNY